MISAVDSAVGGRTEIHSLDASHSPFFSNPEELAGILKSVAA
jgi:hypothetical protein